MEPYQNIIKNTTVPKAGERKTEKKERKRLEGVRQKKREKKRDMAYGQRGEEARKSFHFLLFFLNNGGTCPREREWSLMRLSHPPLLETAPLPVHVAPPTLPHTKTPSLAATRDLHLTHHKTSLAATPEDTFNDQNLRFHYRT